MKANHNMGYARAKGKDWQDVVKQLQGTYAGAARQLGRYEIGIKDMTEEQLRNGEAVDFLAEKYKNFMDGANLTSAEKLKRLGTMWEETKESLGGFVGELMEASNFTDHWTSVLKNLSVELKSSESAWTKFGMVLDALAGGSYNVVQAKIEENRNEAATRYYEEAEKEGKKSDAARVKYYELAKKVAEKRLSDELSLFGDANSTDYDKSKVEEAIKQYKYQIDLITRAAKKSQDKRLEAFRTAKLTGDEAGLGAGMSEPKEGKFQQITITINNPFQNMKNTYANMEAGVNDFMGQLGQALNKVVQDAGILATE